MAKGKKEQGANKAGATRARGRSVTINVEHLERLRASKSLAQEDLAEQAGLSLRGYARIRATGRTSIYTREDLATILSVLPETLYIPAISAQDDFLQITKLPSGTFVRPLKAEPTLHLMSSQVADLARATALSLTSGLFKGVNDSESRFHSIRTTSLPAAISDWTATALRNSMPKLDIQAGSIRLADTAVCLNSPLGALTISSSQGKGLLTVVIGCLNVATFQDSQASDRRYSGNNVEVHFTHDFVEMLNKSHTEASALLTNVHAFVSSAARAFDATLVQSVLDEALRTQSDSSYVLYEELSDILKRKRLNTEVSIFAWDVRCGGRSVATPEILQRAFTRISTAASRVQVSPLELFWRFYSSFLTKEDLFPLDQLGTKIDLSKAKYDSTFQFAEQIILQGQICRGQVLCQTGHIVIEAWYPGKDSESTAFAFADADKLKLNRAVKKVARNLSELFYGSSGTK